MTDKQLTVTEPKQRGRVGYSKGVTFEQIKELKESNPLLTMREAGKILDCSSGNISQHLTRNGTTWDGLVNGKAEIVRAVRADALAIKQGMVLDCLTEAKLKDTSARDLAVIFGVLYDKERLERGQSTSNISLLTTFIEGACDR